MRQNLQLTDDRGTVLNARETPAGIRIYSAVGGSELTRDQADQLAKWLDDGGSSVWRGEAERLRREHKAIREDVAQLLTGLKGAWWLDAAGAYHKLAEWIEKTA